METLDLSIDNYDLNDLLNLFNLHYTFDINDLKQAKKIVLQTHPDKSGLDKAYFLFFSSAYKIIYSIYAFRQQDKNKTTEYAGIIAQEENTDIEKKEIMLQNFKDNTHFNKVFNELFEKYKLEDEDMRNGYAEFMRSDEGIDMRTTTMATMNESFENKKKELKAIIPHKEISDMFSSEGFGTNLTNDKPESYASGLFSALPYEDLRKAHTETVIPINHADYLQRPKYKNVDEFRRETNYADIKPPSLSQSKEYLQQKEDLQDKSTVSRAYKLAMQAEMARKANEGFLNEFQRISN